MLVTRSGGGPLAGVVVRVVDAFGTNRGQLTTDVNGAAGTYSLPEATFTFQVFSQSLIATRSITIVPANDGQAIDFPIVSTAGSIRGTVRQPDGTPVTGGFVQIAPDAVSSVVASATIDANGRYAIDAIVPGSYTAFANVAGRVTPSAPFVISAGQPVVVDIKGSAVATVRITVSRNDGTPIPGVSVYVYDGASTFYGNSATDATGRVSIPNVKEGPFVASIFTSGAFTLVVSRAGTIVRDR